MAALWWAVPLVGAVVLFAPSLWGGATPVPTDILHAFAPWSALPAAPEEVANPLLRDVIDTYHPEQTTIWERLRGPGDAGWLRDAGMGSPGWWFIGTGALSPFLILGLLAGPDIGPALAVVGRLAMAGAGVGLLARRSGVSRAGATVAAGCFAFSGFMIAWLGWPQTSVGAMAGWVWWATVVCTRRGSPWWGVAALAGATAAAWFGGFPAIAALLVLSAAGLAVAEAFAATGDRLAGVVRTAAGLLAGTLLAAVQLLPSLRYLGSVDLAARSEAWRGALPVHLLTRWVAPDVFGDGEAVAYWGRINLIETAAHVGVPALVLAAAAVLWRAREGVVQRAAALAVVTGALAYGFPPLLHAIRFVPGLSTNPPARGVVLTSAAVAVLAGMGLDAVRDRPGRPDRAGVLTLATGLVLLAGALVLSGSYGQVVELADLRLGDPAVRQAARTVLIASLVRAAALAVVSVLLIGAVRGLRATGDGEPTGLAAATAGARRAALVVLVVLAVADPFAAAVGWNTQRPRSELYPEVPALTALTAAVPPPGRIAAASGVLLPMTDLRYGFDDARGRRFLTPDLRDVIEAAGGEFGSPTRWDLAADPARWTSALGALGVQAVVRRPHEPLPPITALQGADHALGPLPEGRVVSGTTTVEAAADVTAVVVRVATYGRDAEGDLEVTASSRAGQRVGTVPAADLADGQLVEVALDDPLPVAAGEPVTVSVTSSAPTEDRALTVFGDGEGAVAASLRTDPAWESSDLGGLVLAEVPEATPWLSLATTVRSTPTSDVPEALAARREPEVVHLPADHPPVATGPQARIIATDVDGRDIAVQVEAPEGAVLRLLEADLPGWTARVDGVPADVVTADGAFVGVVLPPGTSEVTVRWRAPWLATGQALSILAALALLSGSLILRRRSRSTPVSPGGATG